MQLTQGAPSGVTSVHCLAGLAVVAGVEFVPDVLLPPVAPAPGGRGFITTGASVNGERPRSSASASASAASRLSWSDRARALVMHSASDGPLAPLTCVCTHWPRCGSHLQSASKGAGSPSSGMAAASSNTPNFCVSAALG